MRLLFLWFSLPVHCVRCGGRQVRPAAKSERILGVASPPWVLGGKSTWCKWQLFCNPPRCSSVCFESLSSILGCSALRHIFVFCPLAVLRSCARSCQPGWWRPTVKGSGWGRPAEVELDRWVVLLTQPHLIYAGANQRRHPAPLVASSRTLLGISAFCGRGHGAAPQVGTLADWQADWGPADHRRDNAGKTGLTAWSKLVSEYECFGLQMRLLPNSICVQYHCVLQQTKRRSCVLKKAQHWSTNISGSGWPPGGDRIGMMKFEKPRRHFQISFIRLLLPRFSLCQNVQFNLI